jgi:hypothetical protein
VISATERYIEIPNIANIVSLYYKTSEILYLVLQVGVKILNEITLYSDVASKDSKISKGVWRTAQAVVRGLLIFSLSIMGYIDQMLIRRSPSL